MAHLSLPSDSTKTPNSQGVTKAGLLNQHLEFGMEEHVEVTEPLKLLEEESYLTNLHGNGLRPVKLPLLMKMLEEGMESPRSLAVFAHAMEDMFSSVRFIKLLFKLQPSYWHSAGDSNGNIKIKIEGPGLDISLIRDVYHGILQLYNPMIVKRLGDSIIRVLTGIEKFMNIYPASRWSRVLLIILQSPFIGEKGLGDIISTKLFTLFSSITSSVKSSIVHWLRDYPKDIFGGRFVRGVQNYIANRKDALEIRDDIPQDIVSAIKVLSILYEANSVENLVPYTEFYSQAICENDSLLRWESEFIKYVNFFGERDSNQLISFCQVPFLLTPKVKSQILQVEALFYKRQSVEEAVIKQILWHSFTSPFLVLMVNRSNLIADTFRQLSELSGCTSELRKPLKVKFEGEEGVDQGGITKEFFQLLVRELFNVDYGMFVYNEDTRHYWFNHNSMESEHEYWLVGAILGLAIYNGVILDVHFPLVVYKKILNLSPCLDDLKDFQPEVAKSLQQLLDYEGDVSDTFCLCFQVTYDYFGEMRTIDLVPDGGNISVTNDNRQRYVHLYVKYLLIESIQHQFHAFSKAFLEVCGGAALKLFRYEELELLICGLPHFDFNALEKVTKYDGGYSRESEVIKWFWELVREMSFEEKKSLLFFATGNDRVPIGGLGNLKLTIIQNGDDTERLPTAHTCFNFLLLPEYSSKTKLEKKLKLAISNSIGFGLQ
eukprot:TRINITY_DN4700_c0_g3_i1.p1 TRINITY_DN4700_c0_g3~~TRINITY_DN4700_c0_g3_i1.p1  ORF type:complete len:824 (-),score=153.30 TRINITY_DN4700_c0_g3_i1:15-2159(-)